MPCIRFRFVQQTSLAYRAPDKVQRASIGRMVIFFIWVPQCLPLFPECSSLHFYPCVTYFCVWENGILPLPLWQSTLLPSFFPLCCGGYLLSPLFYWTNLPPLLFPACHAGSLSFFSWIWMDVYGRSVLVEEFVFRFGFSISPPLSLHPPVTTTTMACEKKGKISSRFFSGGNGSRPLVQYWGIRKSSMHRKGKGGKSSYLLHARLKIVGGGESDTACDLVEVPFLHEVCSLLQQQQQQQHKAKEEEWDSSSPG